MYGEVHESSPPITVEPRLFSIFAEKLLIDNADSLKAATTT